MISSGNNTEHDAGVAATPFEQNLPSAYKWSDKSDRVWGLLYGIMIFAGYLFLVAPFIMVLVISLSSARSIVFPPPSYSLVQYTEIPIEIISAFFRSVVLGLAVVAVDLVLCVPAAFAIVRGNIPGKTAIEAVMRGPLQVPGVVMAVSLYLAYTALLRETGLSLRNNFYGLIIAHIVITFPYVLATVVIRLQRMTRQLEEASYGLGASSLSTFWRVTFPQIRSAVLAGSILAFVISFEDVPLALFLAPGTSNATLPVQMFSFALDSLSPALFAASILVLLFSIMIVIVLEKLVGLRRVMSSR